MNIHERILIMVEERLQSIGAVIDLETAKALDEIKESFGVSVSTSEVIRWLINTKARELREKKRPT